MALEIIERYAEAVTIIELKGDLIFGRGTAIFRNSIRNLLSQGRKNILIDFKEIGFLDSSGIGELISGYVAVKRENGQLKLININLRVREVLEITRLLTIFEIEAENEFK
jgi:anti-sigma B factor antagonist